MKETFKFAVTESLREISVDGLDPTKKNYSVAEDIKTLQRDILCYEDAIVKMLSHRKARALSVFEARALKGELQKLSLMVNEKGAEIEYTKKQYDLMDSNGVNISTDFEICEDIVVGEITKNFINRLFRGSLSKNDLYRKKEYIERERLLQDEVEMTDTIITTWTIGDVMLGKFQSEDVAVKTIITSKHKHLVENSMRLLENELLTLHYLSKAGVTRTNDAINSFVACHGALVKGTSSIQLIMELAPYGSLEDMLYDEQLFTTFPIALKCAWISDLAEGLQFLYQRDIIHGNVQAKNLFVFETMRIKLGNFHVHRNSLKKGKAAETTITKDDAFVFLPPEARENKEIDISFDIFSFAMTVIQIFSRKKPLIDNFQQQIVHALHVAGLNAMEIRNRLFALLSNCVKADPSVPPKDIRPTGEKIRTEMNQILKTLGGDPRSLESQRSYMVKLEAMALSKRKQKERKKVDVADYSLAVELYSTQSITLDSEVSSISDEIHLIPDALKDEDDEEVEEERPRQHQKQQQKQPTQPNLQQRPEVFENRALPPPPSTITTTPPRAPTKTDSPPFNHSPRTPEESPLRYSGSTSNDSNHRRPPQHHHHQDRDRQQSKPRQFTFPTKLFEPSNCSSTESSSTLDDEQVSVLTAFIREKTHCTMKFAKEAAQILVKNGILDAEVLKRRLQRDRELLSKLKIEEDLAEDLYEVLLTKDASSVFSQQTPKNLRVSSSHRQVGGFGQDSLRDRGMTPSHHISSNRRSFRPPESISTTTTFRDEEDEPMNFTMGGLRQSRSLFSIISSTTDRRLASAQANNMNTLTYCRSEQVAAEIANLYYEASQCQNTKALEKLKHHVSSGDQIAEGFMMRIHALGQCHQPRDIEKARSMGAKLYPWFQLLTETGSELRSIYARYHLAVCYSEGLGVVQDHTIAIQWYKESAEHGYAGAQAYLGFCYYMGIGVQKNHPEAVRWYRIAADQGFCGAQSNLGICYEHGHGVEKNMELAAKYYRQAAEQGAPSAQYNLGHCYEIGEGIGEQNYYESFKWYLQSSQQGYTPAQFALGCYYLVGLGCELDLSQGIDLITKAADKNYTLAQVKLGECYEEGLGVNKNPIKAIKFYQQAAQAGNPSALYHLGYYHFYGVVVERDLSKAVEFFSLAAERHHPVAQHNLAICYQNGFGIKKDLSLALKWYEASARAGYSQAQVQLATFYEKGQGGVTADMNKAINYYRMSAKFGNESAKIALKRLQEETPMTFGRHPNEDYVQVEK